MTNVFVSGSGKTLRFREGEVTRDILFAAMRQTALDYGQIYADDLTPTVQKAVKNLGGVSGLAERVSEEFFGTSPSELEDTARAVIRGAIQGGLPELPTNYANGIEFGYFFGRLHD